VCSTVFRWAPHGEYTQPMQWLRRGGASSESEGAGEPADVPSDRVVVAAARADLRWPVVGLLIWGGACLLPLDGDGVLWWAGRFVLLAALVWLPLALRLIEPPTLTPVAAWVQAFQPWCALLLIASFLDRAGAVAALLATPWALWTVLLGLRGLLRLRDHSLRAVDELCLTLGMLALPVGGLWLLAARADLPVLGFVAPFTLLTGMHFHYAGLLLPTVVGLAGRLLGPCGTESTGDMPDQRGRAGDAWRLYRVLAPAVCLGVWLVAVGITLGGLAEAIAGTLFATLLACLGAVLLLNVPARLTDRLARILLALALLATWPAMALAALYALSRIGRASIGLETMALLHGPLLAVVFVGGGLLAMAMVRPATRSHADGQARTRERST
jgi:hypothetical protein